MHYVCVVDNDIARQNLHATVLHCWLICFSKEANRCSMWRHRSNVESRQIFVSAVYPKLAHADLRQLGAEFSLRGGEKLHIYGAKGRPVRKRVDEAKAIPQTPWRGRAPVVLDLHESVG